MQKLLILFMKRIEHTSKTAVERCPNNFRLSNKTLFSTHCKNGTAMHFLWRERCKSPRVPEHLREFGQPRGISRCLWMLGIQWMWHTGKRELFGNCCSRFYKSAESCLLKHKKICRLYCLFVYLYIYINIPLN